MDNRNLLTLSTFILFIASMSSCTHSFYAPNENIMVQLKDKNEISVSANLGTAINEITDNGNEDKINSFQVGYSPIKGLAIAGSYLSLRDAS